jgi:hypothetical protein
VTPDPGEDTYVPYDFEPTIDSMAKAIAPLSSETPPDEVMCHIYIDDAGRVAKAHLFEEVESAVGAAALEAVRGARCTPASRKDGSSVGVWMIVLVEFERAGR